MPRNNFHERIADYSRCCQCVTEQRLGFASAYFNCDNVLFAVCKHHCVKWIVTGRSLLHPRIPDLSGYSDLVAAFDLVEPVLPSGGTRASTPANERSLADAVRDARKPGLRERKPLRASKPRPTRYRLVAVPADASDRSEADRSKSERSDSAEASERSEAPRERSLAASLLLTGQRDARASHSSRRQTRVILDEAPVPHAIG
jgi:hypothetical protein